MFIALEFLGQVVGDFFGAVDVAKGDVAAHNTGAGFRVGIVMFQDLHVEALCVGSIACVQQFFSLCERLGDGGAAIAQLLVDEFAQFTFRQSALEGIDRLTVLLEENGAAAEWRVAALPATYVVGPTGRIAYAALGSRDWDAGPIAETLRGLAGEK